jgi:O-antigen polymerase
LFFFAIPAYYLLQTVVNNNDWQNIPQYFIINALLMFSCYSILSIYTIRLHHIYKLITIIACLESLYCLFQFLGWLKSDTPSFKITGTWINPNVTAMFLAMAWPATLYLQIKNKKWLTIIAALIILIAMVLLKCRTAFIGVTISTAVILNYQFGVIKNLRQKFTGYKLLLPLLLGLVFISFAAFYLAQSKQASTNGRAFVWKISMNMIAQKPLLGWGYDKFSKEYNYAQAAYFKLGKGNKEEIENASFVRTAYNELLHNAVEGGVIALLILLFFCGSLLINYKQCTNIESIIAYAATASFIVMSLFNFAFWALPSMCLFIVYAAILTYAAKQNIPKKPKPHSKKYNFSVACRCLGICKI